MIALDKGNTRIDRPRWSSITGRRQRGEPKPDRPVVLRTRSGIAAWAWTAGTTAAYTIASLVLFHGVLGDLDDRAPLNGSGDVAQTAWFQSWTASAIAHLHDPFVSYVINAPHGVNLMWNHGDAARRCCDGTDHAGVRAAHHCECVVHPRADNHSADRAVVARAPR
jgi:hypothetical protein